MDFENLEFYFRKYIGILKFLKKLYSIYTYNVPPSCFLFGFFFFIGSLIICNLT